MSSLRALQMDINGDEGPPIDHGAPESPELDFISAFGNLANMSVAELQKTIRQLSPEERRALAVVAVRMVQSRKPARKHPFGVRAMQSVVGCARKVQPGKNSRQILAEMRGYERGGL